MAGATLGASAVLASGAQAAGGNTYVVTSAGDDAGHACSTDGACTLRDAIFSANADGAAGTTNDTITFDSTLTGATITIQAGDGGSYGPFTINTAPGLTIDGSGAPSLSVSAQGNSRVFDITQSSSTVTIENLTITDGFSNSAPGGGAISNENSGSLSLANDTITNSKTGTGDSTYNGGAIYSHGPLTVTASTITGNTASRRGGAIAARSSGGGDAVNISDSTVYNNHAAGGGGIWANYDDVSIDKTQITGNSATSTGTYGAGGGIYTSGGYLSLKGSTVSGNTSALNGGGVADKYTYGSTISNSTITKNTAPGHGGGLEETASNSCRRCAPLAGQGPVSQQPTGVSQALLIENSTLSGNQARYGAGAAIADASNGIPVTVSRSTISGNSPPAALSASSEGGGIFIGGNVSNPMKVVDSTISGNSASHGGGVQLGHGGPYTYLFRYGGSGSISFDNSTIAGNSASAANGGGGIYLPSYSNDSSVKTTNNPSISSTIVAGNRANGAGNDLAQGTGGNPSPGAAPPAPIGFQAAFDLIQNKGNARFVNASGTAVTPPHMIFGKDPQLNPLANNGGPTKTMRPADTSPVIDEGLAAKGLTTDQRGDPRTVNNGTPNPPGDKTDIGAVELGRIPIFASIQPATGINWFEAVLHGGINTNGRPVVWHFEYGRTTAYGQSTPAESIRLGNGNVPAFFTPVLFRGARYHYRLVAVSAAGQVVTTGDETFRTLAPSIHADPGAIDPGKTIHLFGSTGGCPAGSTVSLLSWAFSHKHKVGGEPAIFTTTDGNGHFSVFAKIPQHRKAGTYAMTGQCAGGPLWFPKAPPGHAGDVASGAAVARMAVAGGPAVGPVLIRLKVR